MSEEDLISTLSTESRSFAPSAEFTRQANAQAEIYDAAETNKDAFWAEQARALAWQKPFTKTLDWSNAPFAKWFDDGELNVAFNCLDRHVENGLGDRVAIFFEGEPGDTQVYTYATLTEAVKRAANVLTDLGIRAGDRVAIYLPMIPEAIISMLAVARIGAIHSVVFGGFSADSLATRIQDAAAKLVITADGGYRKGKASALKPAVDEALAENACPSVEHVLVVKRTGQSVEWFETTDIWWHEAMSSASSEHKAQAFAAENPLFILYTSGTTGKPKGILHTSGGYLTQAAFTHRNVFDLKPETDVYWCTADVGWITGHSYVAYGPLANGATQVIYEGTPDAPHPGRWWEIIAKYGVTLLYTAPTAIRSFMKLGREVPDAFDLSSLRVLGSVGEPINPEAWMWYRDVIGGGKAPIVDTWWQTETGGHMITPIPGCTPTKPGSATLPFFGVDAAVLDENGNETDHGILAIRKPWPGITQGIFGDEQRYVDTYWNRWGGKYYFPGDGAIRDKDGYLWITGRVDDVVNVSGHRIGTAELEAIFIEDAVVAESAVIGVKHELKGQGLMAFVILKSAAAKNIDEAALAKKLNGMVDAKIGKFARPERIVFVPDLPKTRSGKIMRRLLRDISEGRELGNVSTLADPAVVEAIRTKFNTTKA